MKMYLKQIKAYGFKSFADKIEIDLCKDINVVVGPNGTGKSNIVDAVRWVLGEQSIKSLRGEVNTDVIFSGSNSRKALNSAQVTLVFDNTDRTLPIDYNEVSIKRIAFRGGDNEYYINNSKCRLKDINDLLIDSGAAKESFNIIGQGKIDEIISTKASDRRVIIEEASNVLKYKKRKEEALRKLDRTMQNINRVNDIISEVNANLEPLRVQSEKAKKYVELTSILKNTEVSLIANDIEEINNDYKINKEKLEKLNDSITKLSSNSSSYDVSLLKEKDKLKSVEEELYNLQSEILLITKNIEKIDGNIKLLKEREKYSDSDKINNNLLQLKEELLSINNSISEVDNSIYVLNSKKDILIEKENTYKNKIEEVKNKINKSTIELNKLSREKIDTVYKKDIMEENISNNSFMPNAVKMVLNNPKFSFVHNTISNLIDVKEEYSLAVNVALSASSNYIVIDKSSNAKEVINYLKENNIGRVTMFPLDVIKSRSIDFNTLSILSNEEGFVSICSNLVSYQDKYKEIILNQLGNVIVVNSIEDANNISKKINGRYKIVTLDGQVVNVGGSITGGKIKIEKNNISLRYELDKLVDKISKLDSDIEKYNNDIRVLNKEILELNNSYEDNSRLKSEVVNDIIRKEKEKNDYLVLKESKDTEYKDLFNITNKTSEIEILLDSYYKEKDNLDEKNKQVEVLRLNKDKISNNIKEIEEDTLKSNSIIRKEEKEVNDLNILINRMDVRLDNLLNTLSSSYNMTYDFARENYKLEVDKDTARSMVSDMKSKINSLGEVNVLSIEEYDRVNERYNFLTSQKDDLLNAKDTLLNIIDEMDEVMKSKFVTTFNSINIEFGKVFKNLFKGGNAYLVLTDPDNILESGVEIKACPPGKKLQSISLLSGGEKTFTAISLLFAILNIKSVPFCIFDEVEAALDDANVESFGSYLNSYKDKTQFILITHKKKTMEFADILYGITMQESGISKLVSVKLEDIKK